MEWMEPGSFAVDVPAGLMRGSGSRYQKRLKDMAGQYANAAVFAQMAAASADTVVYEVTDHRPSQRAGDLITGVTRMSPGDVAGEYFMTRGHLHGVADRPEMYFCLAGKGVMLMEAPDGQTRVLEMTANTICYVPPCWIHRSVNVGPTDFVTLFCYPADSGQDYDIIARSNGMRLRVMKTAGAGWETIANAGYQPRAQSLGLARV
ncbi:glucose-6-phosphate isomerase [Verminephrobacter eiseniae]|nr:glucose-6-phosphate isomerase [Verminephrobacter eiseniae]